MLLYGRSTWLFKILSRKLSPFYRDVSLAQGSFTPEKNIKTEIVSIKTQQDTSFCEILLR